VSNRDITKNFVDSNKLEEQKPYWLYVLKLEDDMYYIGVTSKTPEARMQQHVQGFAGASWTKLHKPVSILDRKDLGLMRYKDAEKYEAKVVRAYMKKYGINNVRGGDLRDTEEYVQRFGWLYSKGGWEAGTTVIFFLFTAVFFAVLYITK
jgi:predicted GIY-YIG superfamily endonuclease